MKQLKKLSRAERVRLASERFKLEPQAVEEALDWIAFELKKRDRRSKLVGDKASRRQVRMLHDAARKAMDIVKSGKLPPMLEALFAASDTLGMLQTMHDRCDIVLTNKLTPKRDDADGFERLLDLHMAWDLCSRRPDAGSTTILATNVTELAAILYGAGNAAAMRKSFKRLFKEGPSIKMAQALEKFEKLKQLAAPFIEQLPAKEKQRIAELEKQLPAKQHITELEEQLQAEEKKPGRK